MEFLEKAKIRMEHWIGHNDQHQKEYETFARQLKEAGKEKSADCIREMIALTAKSSGCLREAIEALE
jgi:hypothetical protein